METGIEQAIDQGAQDGRHAFIPDFQADVSWSRHREQDGRAFATFIIAEGVWGVLSQRPFPGLREGAPADAQASRHDGKNPQTRHEISLQEQKGASTII
jgi:hypothetical protein